MDTLPIINKTYEAYKEIIVINIHITKRNRYGLGTSLENSMVECLEDLIMAKNAPKNLKAVYLIKASSKLEISTLKLRLLLELSIANETTIFQMIPSQIGRVKSKNLPKGKEQM